MNTPTELSARVAATRAQAAYNEAEATLDAALAARKTAWLAYERALGTTVGSAFDKAREDFLDARVAANLAAAKAKAASIALYHADRALAREFEMGRTG